MVYIKIHRSWEIPEREATSEEGYLEFSRRSLLRKTAMAGLAALFPTPLTPSDPKESIVAARRNPKYTLDRPITKEEVASRINNFYEFTMQKDVHRYVEKYEPRPWTVEVTGQVSKPAKFDIDQLIKMMPIEERLYRLRCVEAWSIAVPWTGFQFSELIKKVEPKPKAKFVRFVCINRPDQCPGQKQYNWYPWPYFEGLRLEEAMNELTFAVIGIYGHELPKQHGAPLRMAVPWKYGYKSAKAVVGIEFVEKQPHTFWETLQPHEYPFESNVNPNVPHPRWSQATETVLDTGEKRKTLLYNGYAEFVGHLYK